MAREEDDKKELSQEHGPEFVRAWVAEIESSSTEEKEWRKQAERASHLHRSEEGTKSRQFNIFHANVETLCPAIYNSTPSPDVRRRYQDKDRVGKVLADLLERALSYSIDTYDFDDEMKAAVQDMQIVDRGIARVRYVPYFGKDGEVASEDVSCEYVPWRSFRRGPARLWKDVPWVAFQHFMSEAQVRAIMPKELYEKYKGDLEFTYSAAAKEVGNNDKTETPRFGKRMPVWEVWDKDERKVYFISECFEVAPLAVMDDPLEVSDFFPVPRPLQAIVSTDSLVPVTPLSIYEDQLDELNNLTKRIKALVSQLRPRGGYADILGEQFKDIVEADDGELIPLTGVAAFAEGGGGVDKLVTWFPLDPIVNALKQLVEQREIVKQIIFEVSGMADVMRGSVDPNEKLGQTQMKAQWGGLRIQNKQAEVARFSRDLFRLKAEVMANKFDFENLLLMTGIELPTAEEKKFLEQMKAAAGQASAQDPSLMAKAQQMAPEFLEKAEDLLKQPTKEEVKELLAQEKVRGYRVDIESDSHIRADLMRIQQQMQLFIQGTAAYVQAVGPLVQEGAMPPHIAIEIYSAFARQFKIGKQAEDAIDSWSDEIKKAKDQPKDEEQDPEKVKAQAELQKIQAGVEATKVKAQTQIQTLQAKQQIEQKKLGIEVQKLEIDKERMAHEQQAQQQDMAYEQQTRAQDQQYREEDRQFEMQRRQEDQQFAQQDREHEMMHKHQSRQSDLQFQQQRQAQRMPPQPQGY
jgi:hypothetical protein